MANIRKIDGKNGVSYKITVTKGRNRNGKQVRHYMTWTPDHPMTERQMQKAVERAAMDFERSIEQGYQIDNRQTFAEYAEYVLSEKERQGMKYRTLDRYRELLERINQGIGHIKLADLRPQHLNTLYKNLAEPGVSDRGDRAVARVDLAAVMRDKHLSRAKVAELADISATTVTTASQGKKIARSTAEAIARALEADIADLFLIETGGSRLAPKTILEHHRLIRTILAQAEKEMLVPYNAAAKATPPKTVRQEPDYFQPADIVRIREALQSEPLKWRTITELLIITGCRRGEIMGLRWNRVDFQQRTIRIDTNLLYSPKRGIYEDTTKTEGSVRTIKLPAETTELLKEYRREYIDLRQKMADRWHDTGFLFVKEDGTPMIPDSITSWLRKFSERHGLPHIHPHSFRHSAASILIHSGTDVVTVSKRLGHANTSTTLNIYSHILAESDEQASESLADILLRTGSK